MDMLEHALVTGDQKHSPVTEDHVNLTEGEYAELQDDGDENGITVASGALTIDPSVQYQFRTDGGVGPVTYRVVQVTQSEDGTPQIVTGGVPTLTDQVLTYSDQAIVHSPFNGESPTADALGTEPRFTYVPAVSTPEITGNEGIATATATLGQVAAGGEPSQFYVMMSPQDVLQAGQRNIAPRTGLTPRMEGGRSTRDERRRATHNEVERRRRDKINNWIVQLSKQIPDCASDITKSGQIHSKGGILSKACDYIQDLRNANTRMAESLKETERLSVDAELLRQQCEELKQENVMLRATLQQHGIVLTDIPGGSS